MTTTLVGEETLKHGYNEELRRYVIVHPLDDMPEAKVDTDSLGPMPMTLSVKLSLMSLRGYLILMSALVLFHVLQLAGWFGGVK